MFLQVLVQRFEGLLDRILRSKAYAAGGAKGSSGPSSGGGSKGGGGAEPELTLPVRSLATSFWALGNMGYPLTNEQLDKIAGGPRVRAVSAAVRCSLTLFWALPSAHTAGCSC